MRAAHARRLFEYKQFTICQEKCGHKVGLDGVLFGAYVAKSASFVSATQKRGCRILDVGTGTGLLALIMAQRASEQCCEFLVDAIDMDEAAHLHSKDNFRWSPWKDSMRSHHVDVATHTQRDPGPYGLMICNPPFYLRQPGPPASTSLQRSRERARFCEFMPVTTLMQSAATLLAPGASLWMLHGISQEHVIVTAAATCGLHVASIVDMHFKEGKPQKRIIVEIQKPLSALAEATPTTPARTACNVQLRDGSYAKEFVSLVTDFYDYSWWIPDECPGRIQPLPRCSAFSPQTQRQRTLPAAR